MIHWLLLLSGFGYKARYRVASWCRVASWWQRVDFAFQRIVIAFISFLLFQSIHYSLEGRHTYIGSPFHPVSGSCHFRLISLHVVLTSADKQKRRKHRNKRKKGCNRLTVNFRFQSACGLRASRFLPLFHAHTVSFSKASSVFHLLEGLSLSRSPSLPLSLSPSLSLSSSANALLSSNVSLSLGPAHQAVRL